MDYEGKYFPDEDEVELGKGKKLRKKIYKYSFYGIVAIVSIVTMIVLFANCEAKLYKEVRFSDTARELYKSAPEEFEVYRVYPSVWMNYDGSVQVDTVAYTPTANEMEFGVKYNKNLIVDGKNPTFTIVDTNGNVYKAVSYISESRGRYVYCRISFGDIQLNLNDNVYINPENASKTEGEGEAYDTLKFSFKIEYSDDKEPELFDVFNSKTAIEPMEFKID